MKVLGRRKAGRPKRYTVRSDMKIRSGREDDNESKVIEQVPPWR